MSMKIIMREGIPKHDKNDFPIPILCSAFTAAVPIMIVQMYMSPHNMADVKMVFASIKVIIPNINRMQATEVYPKSPNVFTKFPFPLKTNLAIKWEIPAHINSFTSP